MMTFVTRVLLIAVCNKVTDAQIHPEPPGSATICMAFNEPNATKKEDPLVTPRAFCDCQNDGDCDDGGPGSDYAYCSCGTDPAAPLLHRIYATHRRRRRRHPTHTTRTTTMTAAAAGCWAGSPAP